MVFKHQLTPLRKRGQIDTHRGKGATEEVLPSRHAVQSLTSGEPGARTMNDYAKMTPLANPRVDWPDIQGT